MNGEALLAAAARRTLLGDSAMGTALPAAGLEPGECGELWNVARGDVVSAIHRANLAAGADLVTTNTFGGSALALARTGLGERMRELNLAAARLARAAGARVVFATATYEPTPLGPRTMMGASPADMAAGAAILGGGCGTTPAHIAAFARVLRDRGDLTTSPGSHRR